MKEIDTLRTLECLDTVSIGLFAEGKLGDEEKQRAEEHLLTCLYCLKQLVDMKEMLYYEKHPTPISPELVQRLKPCVRTSLLMNNGRQICDLLRQAVLPDNSAFVVEHPYFAWYS